MQGDADNSYARGRRLQRSEITSFLIVLLLANLLGQTPAHAFKPAKRQPKAQSGGFIDSYGKAFAEYSVKVSNSQGKMQQDERRSLYDDLFSEAKKAYKKEQEDTKKRLGNISKHINKSIQNAHNEAPLVAAQKNGEVSLQAESARQPAAVKSGGTGEIGKAGGADEVKFNRHQEDLFAAPERDGANSAGAESVSFGSK